jgi:3-methylfumaryl-CoA hydratase
MDWQDWIGREERAQDRLTPAMLARLHATLDRQPASMTVAPPLAHWLCFLPAAAQSEIDIDGHPKRGGFLPPIDLPRRMWAGGRLAFHGDLPVDVPLERRSTILNIKEKTGASGRLVFVTVKHDVSADGGLIVSEEQDLVYREAPAPSAAIPSTLPLPTAPPPAASCDVERTLTADPVLLLRFSALTFNAHRIHYDRDYARAEEGYAGLVVHGPLLATLLMHHWLAHNGERRPGRFGFRAQRPLIDGAPFALCLAADGEGSALWTRDGQGYVTMSAEIA